MIDREYWEFRPDWAEYVLTKWEGKGRVEQIKDGSNFEFESRAWQAFKGRFPIRQIKTYINVMMPKPGDAYDDQYPHIHHPANGLTLVHYLTDGSSSLDIFGDGPDGDVTESISPEKGLTVFMPHGLWHGVKVNNSDQPRLVMIATALR